MISAGKSAPPPKACWAWRLRLAGTSLFLILFVWMLWKQDWNGIINSIKGLSGWVLLASFVLLLFRHVCNTTRWFILIRSQGIPIQFTKALKLVFAGLFVSNFLPSMVGGDVVRIAGIFQETEKKIAGVATVFADRIVGTFGMLFALPFATPLIHIFFSKSIFWGVILVPKNHKLIDHIQKNIQKTITTLKIWYQQPWPLLEALIASWFGVFAYAVAVLLLSKGLGIPVTLAEVIGASALIYFITLFPISINGYGLRELAIISFYTHLGATIEQAAALAVITRLLFLLASLPGFFWLGEGVMSDKALTKDS